MSARLRNVGLGILGGLLFAAASLCHAEEGQGRMDHRRVYVGTYTNNGGGSEGIYLLDFDSASGGLELKGVAVKTNSPSFLAEHPALPVLYAVNEFEENGGSSFGAVSAFRVELSSGALTPLNRVTSGGTVPCHLAVAPGGRHLMVANYGSGNVSMLPIGPDGKLWAKVMLEQHAGRGANPQRQEAPHAHCVNFDPSGRFLLSADLGVDRLFVYRFNGNTGSLSPNKPAFAALPPGAGPRHVAWCPSGRYLYVINELNNTVTVFEWDGSSGALSPIQNVSTLPAGYSGENTTAEICVHPSGRFLYASNRGYDSIAMFAIDAVKGTLTPAGHTPTGGKTARHFTLDPSAKFLLVANQDSDSVTVFRVSPDSGQLTATGAPVEVPKPTCLLFVR